MEKRKECFNAAPDPKQEIKPKVLTPFTRLGLDAFCQELLVCEEKDGAVKVIFNDIVAFSMFHYVESIKPHAGINARLTQTFKSAVTKGGGN